MSNNNNKEEFTIDNLVKYLNINNLTSNEQIKLYQNYLSYYKTQPNFSIYLLQIIVNDNNNNNLINSDTKLNASIQLKNYIKNYWKYSEKNINNINSNNNINNNNIIIIKDIEKNNIKENIIDIILYTITNNQTKIRKQLTQCIKYIFYYDFENTFPFYSSKLKNLLEQNDQNKILCSLLIILKLSKIYENENYEKKNFYYNFLKNFIVNLLLNILSNCNAQSPIPNPQTPNPNTQLNIFFKYYLFLIFYNFFFKK